jgi:signal transduction histidine kinase
MADIIDLLGIAASFAVFILAAILINRLQKIKSLELSLSRMKKALEELDEQAKLIVQTDLELNKTQEKLDRRINSLYTLQKLSQAISTTLDEDEVFKRIEAIYLNDLGFEKALAFIFSKENKLKNTLAIGYNNTEVESIEVKLENNQALISHLKDQKIFSSTSTFDDLINKEINEIFGVNTYILTHIPTKEGVSGIFFLGNESGFNPIGEGDEELITIFATQIGQSLDNAHLFYETYHSHQELELKVQERTSELSKALKEINQISRRKTEFVSAVSHELRTPLTSIKGYASLLVDEKLGKIPADAKERLERINHHANELTKLIDNLLDISRIESGKTELKLEVLDLKPLADSVIDLLNPQIKEKNIRVYNAMPKELKKICVDRNQIERVFINLIGNAVKFLPENGKIEIIAKEINDFIQIDIKDNGIGISKEDLSMLFTEFFRADNPINQKAKGTGLGLALAKYVIEAHKGKIWAESQLGKGSTFSFTLPKTQMSVD